MEDVVIPIGIKRPDHVAGKGPAACLKDLCLRFPVFAQHLPLKLRIEKDLIARGVEDCRVLRVALANHTRSRAYIEKVAAGGTRFDLDGQPAGDILPGHQLHAQLTLNQAQLGRDVAQGQGVAKAATGIKEVAMHANTAKITLVITDFDQYVDTNTIGLQSVAVKVNVGNEVITANLNPKTFRKAQAAYRAAPTETSVVLSGQYDFAGRNIQSAGIAAQAKSAPPPQPDR